MKIHKLIRGCTQYPVGTNIMANMLVINRMGKILREFIDKNYPDASYINLICRGSSGAIIAGLVSVILKKDKGKNVCIYHIKKDGESAHGSGLLDNGILDPTSIIVVIDDFIDTGLTIVSIVEKLKEAGYVRHIPILCVTGSMNLDSGIRRKFVHAIISQ